MQKRPKAQSSLVQSHLIYVIPVETGIQFIGFVELMEFLDFYDFDRLLWTTIDFYRLFYHLNP